MTLEEVIREEMKEFYPAVYYMGSERTEENFRDYNKRVNKYCLLLAQAIRDHIREKLPKKKDIHCDCDYRCDCTPFRNGYNQCLSDVERSLGV